MIPRGNFGTRSFDGLGGPLGRLLQQELLQPSEVVRVLNSSGGYTDLLTGNGQVVVLQDKEAWELTKHLRHSGN